jgi:hypothetical protein
MEMDDKVNVGAIYYWEMSLDKVTSIKWMPGETMENSQKIQ